jgi:hypothetical protein
MDLHTLKTNIMMYATPLEMIEDFRIIFKNCAIFNAPGSDILKGSGFLSFFRHSPITLLVYLITLSMLSYHYFIAASSFSHSSLITLSSLSHHSFIFLITLTSLSYPSHHFLITAPSPPIIGAETMAGIVEEWVDEKYPLLSLKLIKSASKGKKKGGGNGNGGGKRSPSPPSQRTKKEKREPTPPKDAHGPLFQGMLSFV